MVMKSYLAFLVVISLIIVVAPSSKVEDPMVKEGRSGSASVLMAGYEQVSDFELLFENVAAAYLRPGWEDIDVARFTLTVSEDAQAPVRMRGFTFTIDGINSKTFTNFVMTLMVVSMRGRRMWMRLSLMGSTTRFGLGNRLILSSLLMLLAMRELVIGCIW